MKLKELYEVLSQELKELSFVYANNVDFCLGYLSDDSIRAHHGDHKVIDIYLDYNGDLCILI